MRGILSCLPVLLVACGTTPAKPEPKQSRSPQKAEAEASPSPRKGEGDRAIDRNATRFLDDRPVPKPTAQEMEDFNRIWVLFRKRDVRWPIQRDRFKRRSDAAAYMLAGHLLNFYMQVNVAREKAPKELIRAKNEIVAVGEPCVLVLVDLMVLDRIPVGGDRYFLTDDITRRDCVDMLERIGPRAVPYLLRALERKDLGAKGRRLIALALGGTRDPRAYEPLVALLKEDPSWQVRADAATGLAKLGDRRAVAPLAEAAKKDPDPAVAKRAKNARARLLQGRPG